MRFPLPTQRAILNAASLLLVAVFSTPALAADAPPKIAVLDMASALFNSERAQVVQAEIEQQTAEDQAKLTEIQEQATAISERAQTDAAVMSDEEKRKVQTDLQDLSVQYQAIGERVQALLEERRNAFQQEHAQALITAIGAVIEEGQYDIVLRAEAVIHHANAIDITPLVTEKLNQTP